MICVRAGPAGASAGKIASEKRLKVLMPDRSKLVGDKNISGSVV